MHLHTCDTLLPSAHLRQRQRGAHGAHELAPDGAVDAEREVVREVALVAHPVDPDDLQRRVGVDTAGVKGGG